MLVLDQLKRCSPFVQDVSRVLYRDMLEKTWRSIREKGCSRNTSLIRFSRPNNPFVQLPKFPPDSSFALVRRAIRTAITSGAAASFRQERKPPSPSVHPAEKSAGKRTRKGHTHKILKHESIIGCVELSKHAALTGATLTSHPESFANFVRTSTIRGTRTETRSRGGDFLREAASRRPTRT